MLRKPYVAIRDDAQCLKYLANMFVFFLIGLYTDESPGLKVDPVVVLVLSLVFIFSVVALHSTLILIIPTPHSRHTSYAKQADICNSHCEDHPQVLRLNWGFGMI